MKKHKSIITNIALVVVALNITTALYYALYQAGELQTVWLIDTVIAWWLR